MNVKSIIATAGIATAIVAGAGVAGAGSAQAAQTDYYQGGAVCITVTSGYMMGTVGGEFLEGKLERARGWKKGITHVANDGFGLKFTKRGAVAAPYYGEMGTLKIKKVSGKKFRAAGCGM